jgi:predicted Rossmann-fold nucleotide-binding protein
MKFEVDLNTILYRYESPRVGVIGSGEYENLQNAKLSRLVGQTLRKFIGNEGWLFTGGVGGVGYDVYRGILDYSKKKRLDDRFFALIPKSYLAEEYDELSAKTLGRHVRVEVFGYDWEHRRKGMSLVGDALIMIEGGGGTDDEARHSLRNQTPLITFPESGGAASEYNKKSRFVHPVNNVNEMTSVLSSILKRK